MAKWEGWIRVSRGRRIQRRQTPFDLQWPEIAEYVGLAQNWSEDAIERMLRAVWDGYDALIADLAQIDMTEAEEELERTITQLLEPCIRQRLSGDEPYYIQHGPYEYATRQPAPAQPPQYDMAFVLHQNRRVMWPLEAKILRNDNTVAGYVKAVKCEFLTGRYAPYTSSAAMLGYLLQGSPARALGKIRVALACTMRTHGSFNMRNHRISDHSRNLTQPGFVSGPFQCHHLMMVL